MYRTASHSIFELLFDQMAGLRAVLYRRAVSFGQTLPVMILAWQRLKRIETGLQRLLTLQRAGKLVARVRRAMGPTPERPAPVKPVQVDPSEPPVVAPTRLPRGHGWLSKLIKPDAFYAADRLSEWIVGPEMLALGQASSQAGRLLRSLCHALGVKLAPLAQPKPERKKPAPNAVTLARQAERAEAKRQRELAQTSSKKSVVPKGHSYPTTERGWAIWARRNKRNERRWRAAKRKSA